MVFAFSVSQCVRTSLTFEPYMVLAFSASVGDMHLIIPAGGLSI